MKKEVYSITAKDWTGPDNKGFIKMFPSPSSFGLIPRHISFIYRVNPKKISIDPGAKSAWINNEEVKLLIECGTNRILEVHTP